MLPSHPVSAITPRIEVLSELGSGATGRVQRGRLLEPHAAWPAGTEVAVKHLLPALVENAEALAAFRSEAEAGLAVAHPGLVHVLFTGEDELGPFLVMEYVPGETLREVLQRTGALPEPMVRSVGEQLGCALAALHGEDYVHGDVKPENVRLDAEGRAVLIDLGFARAGSDESTGSDELTGSDESIGLDEPKRAGSLAYLSPEQARGDLGSESSDVFSLGLLLYELATGTHPVALNLEPGASPGLETGFSSTSPGASSLTRPGADRFLASLAAFRFVPPSRVVPRLSPFLDSLLQEMLKREESRRPSSAEVGQRFGEQEGSPWWRAKVDFQAPARRLESALHFTPLVGRADEIAALGARFRRVTAADTELVTAERVAWLVGPEGMGKSRLMNEFAAGIRQSSDPPLYLYGRCSAVERERPYAPILRWLHRYLQLPTGTPPGEGEIALLEELLPPVEARAVVDLLDPHSDGQLTVAVPEALANWLAALGAKGPVVAFLDDLNFAGEGTLAVVTRWLSREANSRLFLVLGMRNDTPVLEPKRLEHVATRLGSDWREPQDRPGSALSILLTPLEEGAIQELVNRLFHETAPRLRIAHALHERSQGSPGLLVEILRGLEERGQLVPHADSDRSPGRESTGLVLTIPPDRLPLPRSLRGAIQDRYRGLSESDRMWLHRLAVVGGRIDAEFLGRAFPPANTPEIDEMLARLVRSGWLATAGYRYRFARPALREAVHRSIPEDRRTRLHAAAARALAADASGELSIGNALQRAFHLQAAGEHELLLRLLRPLTQRLLARGRPQRVHVLARWGLEALDALQKTPERGRLRIELLEAAADAADRLGHRREQRRWLDRLSDLDLDPQTDREALLRVYLLHGRYAVSTGQYGLARGMLRNAVELSGKTGGALVSEALRRLAAVQAHVGELKEARTLALRSLELAAHDAQRAVSHLQIGIVDVLEDRIEAALKSVDRALKLLRRQSGWRIKGAFAAAHLLRGRIYRVAGRPRRAMASMERAVRLAGQAGERRLEAEALARFGGLLLDSNRPEEAEAQLREAQLLSSEIEDRRGQALAGLWLAIGLLETNAREAGSQLRRVRALAREMGLNRVEALALAVSARLDRAAGRLQEADRQSQTAALLLERHGAELADRIVILGTRALCLRSLGREDEAAELERGARRRLEREHERIQDSILRQRYRSASTRLLETVLSEKGALYPRVNLPWGRGPLVPPRPRAS